MKRSSCREWPSIESIAALEARLNESCVPGAGVGSMITDILYVHLLCKQLRTGVPFLLKSLGRCVYHSLFGLPSGNSATNLEPGRYMLTMLSSRPHLAGLILPVVEALGREKCAVLGPSEVKSIVPPGTLFVSNNEIPAVSLNSWRTKNAVRGRKWFEIIAAFCKQHNLPITALPVLLDATIVQTQRLASYSTMLDRVKPLAVITEYDRNMLAAPLIVAAREKGIPCITLVHGAASRLYTPILADIVCCWGESGRNTFIRHGVAAHRIRITGNPSITNTLPELSVERREMIAGSTSKVTIAFLTSPISLKQKLELADDFCRAISMLEKAAGLIRLHPSERKEDYEKIRIAYPEIRLVAAREASLGETLAAVDIVVVHNSTAGAESIIKGKPTLVLNSIDGQWDVVEEFIGDGNCLNGKNSEELASLLGKMVRDAHERFVVTERAAKYRQELCFAFHEAAAQNIARCVHELTTTTNDAIRTNGRRLWNEAELQ